MTPLTDNDLQWITAHAGEDTQALRGQKIFITGGTGFVGSWLVEYLCHASQLLQLDLQLTVLSRNPASFFERFPHMASKPMLRLVAGDVLQLQPDGSRQDIVIHAATDASAQLNRDNPLLMADTIVDGTRHVLEYARASGTKKILMLSSGAVYGKLPSGLARVPEDFTGGPDPLDPFFTYAESKRMAELLCVLYARQYGIEIPVARLFAFLGPRLPLDAHFAAGNFLRDALAGGPIKIAGDGTAVRSYLYAAELVVWLLAILARGSSGRAYNVGSGEPVSILALAQQIAAAAGNVAVQVAGCADASNPVNYYVPDVARARVELGLQVLLPLEDGICRTVENLLRERRFA